VPIRSLFDRDVCKSLTSSLKEVSSLYGQVSSQVTRHYGQVKSRVFQVKSQVKSLVLYAKSQVKSLPTLSFLPCMGHSFTNYVMQICVISTHSTHIMYYGDALVNNTNTIPPSTIPKISLSQSALSTIHSSTTCI